MTCGFKGSRGDPLDLYKELLPVSVHDAEVGELYWPAGIVKVGLAAVDIGQQRKAAQRHQHCAEECLHPQPV
jgi:hypothetical protein